MKKNKLTIILAVIAVIALIGWGVTAGMLKDARKSTDPDGKAVASVTENIADNTANEDTPEENISANEDVSGSETVKEPDGEGKENAPEAQDSESGENISEGDPNKEENTSDASLENKKDDKEEKSEDVKDSGIEEGKGTGKKGSDNKDTKIDDKTEDKKDTEKKPVKTTASGLHVDGTHLADAKGNAVQLRGVSTHGLAWFPAYVNKELFNELASDWGANVVRLAMYTEEYGGYCSGGDKEALKKLVKDGVKYAADAGMYAIVDWHILSDGDPTKNKEEAKKFFKEITKDLSGYNNVLYEICNEPNGGTSWSTIKKYAEEIIPVIRKNAPDAVIIVGTPTWSQEVDKAAADPITTDDNVVYALHFYAATHKDDLRNKMVKAVKAGLPVFVSEFGICDASGNGGCDEKSANEWIKQLDKYGISYVCWNLANKNESSSLFLSGCSKTSGFNTSDLSDEGKWLKKVLTKRAGKKLEFEDVPEDKQDDKKTDQKADNSGKEDSKTDKTDSGSKTPKKADISGESGNFAYTATVINTWEENGKTNTQYTISVTNNGNSVDKWEVNITFGGKIKLNNSWNCVALASENVLTIKNAEHAGSLEKNATVSDIGVIIIEQ